ncbi:hypothetical protein RHGRI_030759 [Rhododendron griersonianum]|uniref:Uncharacterized protein n=1 Tax=Rhododendron griersonianum TaxID=479676 RepID=A0AAV6I590_9ERIC|nr:hypothetical protein RHGRI_030759 [Rhododendron griersonianum]
MASKLPNTELGLKTKMEEVRQHDGPATFHKEGDLYEHAEKIHLTLMELSSLAVTSNCSHTSSRDALLLGYGF